MERKSPFIKSVRSEVVKRGGGEGFSVGCLGDSVHGISVGKLCTPGIKILTLLQK